MRVLMFTRKMDKYDDRMGTYHDYVEKLSKKVDKLFVLCLEKRKTELPKNVEVYSLGKEKNYSNFRCFLNCQSILWKIIRKVDVVFCHMNPIYTIMAAPIAKLFRKPIVTWYGHLAVTPKLYLMDALSDVVVTSDPTAYGIKSKKVKYIGHGIDTNQFRRKVKIKKIVIIWLGRISRVKKIELLIEAVRILVKERGMKDIKIFICGEDPDKGKYEKELKDLVKKYKLSNNFDFTGKVPNIKSVEYYNKAKIAVSMLRLGGSGKTNLEAMACELPLVTCSAAFDGIIKKYRDIIFFDEDNVIDFADKIERMLKSRPKKLDAIGVYLRKIMIQHFDTNVFLDKLINVLKESTKKN